ncbi:MAG: membrane protein DedA with SNARE-associated domain [Flavobacteriaceae bacterium]|jgi:membrane protein DedA with SNARE-associated domain
MIAETFIQTIGAFSYVGVFIFSLLANMVMPVPEEVFLLIVGYLGGIGVVKLWISGLIIFCGLTISDIVLYHLSRGAGKIVSFLRKKLVGKDKDASEINIFRPHINKFIFFSRFFVGFRWIGPVLAGSLRIPKKQFLIYNSLALVVYIPFMLWLGYFFRNRIEELITRSDNVKYFVLIAIGIIVLLFFSRRMGKYMFDKAKALFASSVAGRVRGVFSSSSSEITIEEE